MNQKMFLNIVVVALTFALSTVSTLATGPESLRETLGAELRLQADAWNRGDLKTFTSIYTEDAKFVAPGGVTTGRDEVLARYAKKYPDLEAMGNLELEILSVLPLGCRSQNDAPCAASLVARWTLRYPEESGRETVSGHTLLVFVREEKKWRIAQDASM